MCLSGPPARRTHIYLQKRRYRYTKWTLNLSVLYCLPEEAGSLERLLNVLASWRIKKLGGGGWCLSQLHFLYNLGPTMKKEFRAYHELPHISANLTLFLMQEW